MLGGHLKQLLSLYQYGCQPPRRFCQSVGRVSPLLTFRRDFGHRTANLSGASQAGKSVTEEAQTVPSSPGLPTKHLKEFEDVPGPKGLPFLGTSLGYIFGRDGLSFAKLYEVNRQRYLEYGPIYREVFGPHRTIVMITDYQEYKKVIHADGKMPMRILLDAAMMWRKSKGVDGGLLSNGEEWLKYRSAVSKKMLRPKEVAQYIPHMDESTKDMVSLIEYHKDRDGVIKDIGHILFKWSLETINTYLLETRLGALDLNPSHESTQVVKNVREFFRQSQDMVFKLPYYKLFPTKAWRDYVKINEELFGFQYEIVNKRFQELKQLGDRAVADDEPQSVISYLLTSSGLSSHEATHVLSDLMGAAVDTASNTTMWGLYLLTQNPDVQETLYNELSSVLGDDCETITAEMMNQLPYTKACVKEAMRLYPVAISTSRILQKDLELFGYNIPAGTTVSANLWTMFRDPDVFTNPDSFVPERWLSRAGSSKEDMAVTNLVWGHGARMCVGRRLAEQEMYLGLARLVEKYKFAYAGKAPPEPNLRLVLCPKDPISIRFTLRK